MTSVLHESSEWRGVHPIGDVCSEVGADVFLDHVSGVGIVAVRFARSTGDLVASAASFVGAPPTVFTSDRNVRGPAMWMRLGNGAS